MAQGRYDVRYARQVDATPHLKCRVGRGNSLAPNDIPPSVVVNWFPSAVLQRRNRVTV